MGFFDDDIVSQPSLLRIKGVDVEFLHRQGCNACPLSRGNCARSPQMEPSGATKPVVYMLGEFPTALDDRKGRHFVGTLGSIVTMRIPVEWDGSLRWNYVVRTLPPGERAPTDTEIECCRPSIERDIEQTKPKAIIGFGALALQWMVKEARIDAWAGRRIPVKIGSHVCWFFPMLSPRQIAERRRFEPRNADSYGCDDEFKFALDMRRAFASIDALPEPVVYTRDDALRNVVTVTGHDRGDLQRVLDFLASCENESLVGVDYETSCLRPYLSNARILSIGVAKRGAAMAFAYRHRQHGWTDADLKVLTKAWRRFLMTRTRKVSHHLGFEGEWTAYAFGCDALMDAPWEDSLAQAYLLDERPKTHGLETLCLQHFGLPIKSLFPTIDRSNMEETKLETILTYNAVDAKFHRGLFVAQRSLLHQENMLDVYRHHVRRIKASVLTTIRGVPVDQRRVEKYYTKHMARLREIENEVLATDIARGYKAAKGRDVRLSNNHDVVEALQKIAKVSLEHTINKRRKKQIEPGEENFSTKEEALKKVDNAFAQGVIRYRKVSKLISTYIIPVRKRPTMVDGKEHPTQLFPDGRLHPVIATTKVRTWRTSSEAPNIQNWPKRGPAKYIRKQIAVADDEVIVAIDYAGIQARNVAMESKDRGLIQHYWEHYDIHSDWLERLQRLVGKDWRPKENIGDVTGDKLHKELRSAVKNKFVFPSFFGAVGKTVAGYLGIEERQGEALSEEFFSVFPDVKAWHERCRAFYFKHGYISGLSGFRRHAPIEINQLINAPIQADEARIVCGAWYRCCELGGPYVPNWMIHDDLTFIWKKADLDKCLETVVPVILYQENDWEKCVPMEIEISIGKNWCDLEEIAKFETTKSGGIRQSGGDYDAKGWR